MSFLFCNYDYYCIQKCLMHYLTVLYKMKTAFILERYYFRCSNFISDRIQLFSNTIIFLEALKASNSYIYFLSFFTRRFLCHRSLACGNYFVKYMKTRKEALTSLYSYVYEWNISAFVHEVINLAKKNLTVSHSSRLF